MASVLIFDDDESIRATVRMVLEDEGYTVLDAATGPEALQILEASDTPLIVLVDLLMPNMNGVEVLREVVARPPLAERHAYIVFTADERALLAAAQPYILTLVAPTLNKPFDMEALLDVVAKAATRLQSA